MKVRMKRVLINPEALFTIMKNGTAWRVGKGISKTAKLRGCTLDPMTQNLVLFIEDQSFEEIDVTNEIAPLLETEFRKIRI